MASFTFPVAVAGLTAGTINWASDSIRMALLTGTGAPALGNTNLTAVFAEANVAEATATNYARQVLGTKTKTTTSNQERFGSADAVFDESSNGLGNGTNEEITGALIYKHVDGTNANDIPIAYIDFTTNRTTNGSAFTVSPNATPGGVWFVIRQPS